jgi:hypothetical protein
MWQYYAEQIGNLFYEGVGPMREDCEFYICPICFEVSETAGVHHERPMIYCQELPLGDEMLQPEFFKDGNLKSRAPRWFLHSVREAVGLELLDFDDHHLE